MIIKGLSKLSKFFERKHPNDAGLDIGLPYDVVFKPGLNVTNLHTIVDIPAGYVGFLFPRSSAAKKGLNAILVPIDPGYSGDIHAFIVNSTDQDIQYQRDTCVVQLVVLPVAIATVMSSFEERGDKAFNSSGR